MTLEHIDNHPDAAAIRDPAFHRAMLSQAQTTCGQHPAEQQRAAALSWLLRRTDDPPSTLSNGGSYSTILANYSDALAKAANRSTIAPFPERRQYVARLRNALAWGLEAAGINGEAGTE